MVKYYGRARTRTGSVNTNQLGLKMSGCPSTVGKQGRIARYMGRRVDCMMGLCKPIRYHEVIWPRTRMRNQPPFCQAHATKCLASAGGVGTNHNIPYYRIPAAGESGCTPAAIPLIISAGQSAGNSDFVGWSSIAGLIGTGDPQPTFGSLVSGSTSLFDGRAQLVAIWTDDDGSHPNHDFYMYFRGSAAAKAYITALESSSVSIHISSGPGYSLTIPFSELSTVSDYTTGGETYIKCRFGGVPQLTDAQLWQPGRAYQIEIN